MNHILSYAAAFLPVLLFLVSLRQLDSYKLTPRNRIIVALVAGGAAAMLSFSANSYVFRTYPEQTDVYARLGAPLVEEIFKACYWILLISTARVAFMVDSGICAFGIGAGFSLVENFFYLQDATTSSLAVSILRGFGTATMHGGVASIGAMTTIYLSETYMRKNALRYLPGLGIAYGIHAFFNQGLVSPATGTLLMLFGMPVLIVLVFVYGESTLRSWLGEKLDEDIELLDHIANGNLHMTRSGAYLQSLQDVFPPEIRGDMLCMLQLTTELSIRAKADLLLQEAGLEIPADPEIEGRFQELAFLEKSIGPTGMLALKPLLSKTPRDLWELRRLAMA